MPGQTARVLSIIVAAFAVVSFGPPARAQSMFGALSNMDVINDTGQITRGFEIDLEGIHAANIFSTFGAPYERYGDPQKIDTATGVIIRYESTWSAATGWAVGTPVPPAPIVTGGHRLFFPAYGGDAAYPNIGGDHFGVCYNGNASSTTYHWIFGNADGTITAAANVTLPSPTFTVAPANNPAVAPAAVQAVIQAPPKPPAPLFGDAIWAKIFITESTAPAELNHLLVGDPAMPDRDNPAPAEVEVEWQLLQVGKGAAFEQIDSGLNDLNPGAESVTRRYEFYKYNGNAPGAFDEVGEALLEDAIAHPEAVGAFIGGNNAAVNLAEFAIPEPAAATLLLLGVAGVVVRRRR